jgi:hypothetical protein
MLGPAIIVRRVFSSGYPTTSRSGRGCVRMAITAYFQVEASTNSLMTSLRSRSRVLATLQRGCNSTRWSNLKLCGADPCETDVVHALGIKRLQFKCRRGDFDNSCLQTRQKATTWLLTTNSEHWQEIDSFARKSALTHPSGRHSDQNGPVAQFTGSAARRASSRAVSLNGLIRHSMAPCSSRRGRIVSSP